MAVEPSINRPATADLPRDHPRRLALNDEVHARPSERVAAPSRISYLALMADKVQRQTAWRMIGELAVQHGAEPPDPVSDHYTADVGPIRLRAERHNEFYRLNFSLPGLGRGGAADPFADPAIDAVPAAWVAALPGELLVAAHVAIVVDATWPPDPALLADGVFERDEVIGAATAGEAGSAFTDLRIRPDGFGRLLIVDRGMTAGQTGRALQRLLEMDTYRMLALLAFPEARALIPTLTAIEQELAGITAALVDAVEADEPALLERLTRLAAQIENRQSETLFRFSAAASYYDLAKRRILELREARIQGLQTFREFTERRLAPAMNTCRSVTDRLEALSVRVGQATRLLSTRVDLSSERQSRELLISMNRRAQLQLRLQETVEGFSVAAITYYVVGLVGHAADALKGLGVNVKPDIAMGVAIPIVALLALLGLRQIRRHVSKVGADHP